MTVEGLLPVLALLVPFITAIACLLAGGFTKEGRRTLEIVSMAGAVLALATGLLLLYAAWTRGPLVVQFGDWPVPLGIVFVADVYGAGMVAYTGLILALVIPYSVQNLPRGPQTVQYHAVFHLMAFGATGAFLTGDLFNLFVWFEVLLIASYLLVGYHGTAETTSAAFRYLVVNLTSGILMLVGVALLYGALGTLNMAHLAERAAALEDPSVLIGPAALLLAAFLTKAGCFPFHHWVPAAYDAAPSAVAAFLASVSKNVGIYAIVRVFLTVFQPAGVYQAFQPAILAMTGAGIVYGGYMAYTQARMDQVLSYHAISQVGLILVGVGVGGHLGVLATVLYGPNHGLIQATLFLSSGNVRRQAGTDHLDRLGGLARHLPLTSAGFLVGAMALIGLPPMNGFFSKFVILDASVRAVQAPGPAAGLVAIFAVACFVAGAFFTVASLSKLWGRAFWGRAAAAVAPEAPRLCLAAVVLIAGVLLAIGVGFEAYAAVAERALSGVETGATARHVLRTAAVAGLPGGGG